MTDMKLISFEDLKDKYIGKTGSPERDAYEEKLKEEVRAYHIGEAIKAARKERNMTQDQLAEIMGVKKAQISRIERGYNPTINTVAKVFHALGMGVSLNCGNMHISL